MSNNSNESNLTCFGGIKEITDPLQPYQTLSLLVPTDDRVWTERDLTWNILFIIIISLLAVTYFCIGLTSVVLMIRKDCLRIATKTFFAVYLTMAILGFSRAILFVVDPFGILGFIGEPFQVWIIVSRYLASVGFPSLVGACTLIVLTLVKLAKTSLGKQWYEYWSYSLIVIAIPYTIAITAETLGHIQTYTALLTGLTCETFFVIWGVSICIFYLIAGKNLLNKVNTRHRKATMLSESTSTTNTVQQCGGVSESSRYFAKQHSKAQRIKRKIVIVTFGTAVSGILYALVSAGGVAMVLLLIFYDCMGSRHRTNSAAWLAVQFTNYITEILLAIFILYSMTDMTKFVEFLKLVLSCCCYCCFGMMPAGGDDSTTSPGHSMEDDPETASGHVHDLGEAEGEEAEMQRARSEIPCETSGIPTQNRSQPERRFQIELNDPDGSLQSSESPPGDDRISQRRHREKKISVAKLNGDVGEEIKGRKVSAAQLERPVEQKRGKKISVSQLEDARCYNSTDTINKEEQPLDTLGKILSVEDSPTVGRSFQLRFFRRTPSHSRETTPTADNHDRRFAQTPDVRRLRHFPSSPSPASPHMHELYSKHFASSHPVKSPHLPLHVTSPLTPNSPQSPYKPPTETQRLLEKHDSTPKLSRKGTI